MAPDFLRPAAALLLVVSFAAGAAPSTPSAPEVDAALKRALAAGSEATARGEPGGPGQAALRAMLDGRARSLEVQQVQGCVVDQPPEFRCIVRIDWGLGKIRHAAVPLRLEAGQWEVPALARLAEEPALLRVPAPTPAQAQAAARAFAQSLAAEGQDNAESRAAASGLEMLALADDCRLDRNDGSVACDARFSLPATAGAAERQVVEKRSEFHLEGSDWRFGRPAPAP